MTTLSQQLLAAKTTEDLQTAVRSIKKQENGFKNSLARHLDDAFWYCNMENNFELQQKWMIKVTYSYPKSLRALN